MIALLVATRAEALFFLKEMRGVKSAGIFHYRGQFAGKSAALFLTRPGVHSREQVRRFLRLHRYDAIINCGSCASLTAELAHLHSVLVGAVVSPGHKWLTIATGVRKCVSVGHLVADDDSKALLRETSGADILDMETYTIAGITAEKEFAAVPFYALRVVDDLAGEELYLKKEQMLREMTLRRPTGRPTLRDILRLGVWDYSRILWRRHRVARAIAAAAERLMANLKS